MKSSVAVFPISDQEDGFVLGTVVSLDEDGKLIRKSGTTIYKNQHVFPYSMFNAQAISLASDIFAIVYNGKLMVIKLSAENRIIAEKEVRLPSEQIGKERVVDCAIRVAETNMILIFGNSEIIPTKIVYNDNLEFEVEFSRI